MNTAIDMRLFLVRLFQIKQEDVSSFHRVQDTFHIGVSYPASERVLAQNGRRVPDFGNVPIAIKELPQYPGTRYNRGHSPKMPLSDIMFRVNKIPSNWQILDVVRYFDLSCNAPLQCCYRLSTDRDSLKTQSVFVEFKSAGCAMTANNVLRRTRNSLGMEPVELCNVRKFSG